MGKRAKLRTLYGAKIPLKNQVLSLQKVSVRYGDDVAVQNVTLPIARHKITAIIGPSGCGKTTTLRSMNRMIDPHANATLTGEIIFEGADIYDPSIDPVALRQRIGMVFQRPNPFPKSIYENVAYGPRLLQVTDKHELDDLVEVSLRKAALWDEVKDKLQDSAYALSGGQQQRLCIARALSVKPEILLMDEPCSALDPIATRYIEALMRDLCQDHTIVIVTHSMSQAKRVSDYTAYFGVSHAEEDGDTRWGVMVEFGKTADIFKNPLSTETKNYIQGKFG